MVDACLIGIDVGTTALKAVLIGASGRRLAAFSQAYGMARPEPGAAEQDPEEWVTALFSALANFEGGHDLSGLQGIGICSQVNTHVFVGADGLPVRPAIVWQDSRAAEEARRIEALVSEAQKTAWFGGPVPIDASHALSRMAFVARREPRAYAGTEHVLLPKDYCIMRLTGAVCSDPVSAVGLVAADGYVDDLLALVPRAAALLPELFAFSHVAGRVRDGLPCAGAPVVVGAMDAWGGMFGVGVSRDGQAMLQSGTSEIPGIVSARIVPTPGVVLFPPYEGIVMHAAPTQAGGAALTWIGDILNRTPPELSELVETISPSSAVPLFLPHLDGERAPLWDSASRAVFARMDPRAGAAELARSVMEGVAFSVRLAFSALQKSADTSIKEVNIGGGGSRSDPWCHIRADALQMRLRRTEVPEVGALGAAILAGLGSGAFASVHEAVAELVRFDRVFEPDAARTAYYDEQFANYQALYASLIPFNRRY